MCHVRCLVRMEGAEYCAFGAVGRFGMVDAVDQQGQTKDIGEENKFLVGAVNTGDSDSLEHDDALSNGAPTCRTSVQVCPVAVKKRSPAIHSCVLSRVSLAKSWRWCTKRSRMYLKRSFGFAELIATTFSVILSMVRSFKGGMVTFEGSIMVLWETK